MNKVKRRIFVMLTCVVALSMLVGACAPSAGPATDSDADTGSGTTAGSSDQIELRIAWWGSQNRHDRTIEVIEMFEELHPNIDVVYEFSGWEDHWTKMTTQASGGNMPDIMQQDYARLEEWVSRGLIMPIDQYIEDGTIDLSNVSESAVEGGIIDGQLYGINLGTNSMVVVIDADKFAEAEVEIPEPDWTFTDLEETATQLHEALGIHGFSGGLSNEQLWKNIYLSLGEWVYSEDGTSLGYENDEPLLNYLDMVYRLQEAGVTASRAEEIADQGQSVEANEIVTGEAAMTYIWSNQIVAVSSAAGEDRNFVLLPMPRPEGGASANYLKPSMFFSITSQAKHPDEAAMFIDFFTNSIEANEVLMAERGVPISSEVRSALEPMLNEPQELMFNYIAEIEPSVSPIPPPDVAGHADVINNVYWPLVMDPFLYGEIGAEEAVQTLRTEANAVLGNSAN